MDINRSPYYNDYDPTKKYTQLLALPGRVEQAREFTQIQSMFLDFLSRVGGTILKDGGIIDGCSIVLQNNIAKITPGKIYYNGIVHFTEETNLEVTLVGEENIGVKVEESIITEVEDMTLREPAQGYDNYNKPGCHRLKRELVFTVNDPSATTIFSLQDGQLLLDEVRPQLDIINDLLARRTYDESGNYKVSGFNFWASPKDNSSLTLTVEPGKAYIMGYEVGKPTPVKITVSKSLNTRLVSNEPKVFATGTNKYKLNNAPVKSISKIVATVQVTKNDMVRGNIGGGIDFLPKSPVVQILSVTQGATTYTAGVDYQLTADGIDWALPGIEPSVGSSYSSTWRYNKTMIRDVDFKLTQEGSDFYIDFGLAGDKPVNATTFLADYDYYLSRKDLICLNKNGNIQVITGQSEIPRLVVTPVNPDFELLNLGTMYLPPNSDEVICNPYSITRISMEDLQNLMLRIQDLEYNQAVDALNREAMEGEPPTDLKGILCDNFASTSRSDMSHPDFSIAFDFEMGEIVLPVSRADAYEPDIDVVRSVVHIWDSKIVTAPFTEANKISQNTATSALLVNPYNVFNNQAVLKLYPEVDNWVDTQRSVIEGATTQTYRVTRWWWQGGGFWNSTEKYLADNLILDSQSRDSASGTITSQKILEEAILYMRQREVQIEGKKFLPNSDNLECYFDGVLVSLVPVAPTIGGSIPGSVRADGSGNFLAKFVIPEGIRTGTRELVIKNLTNVAVSSYTANGVKRDVIDTVIRVRVTRINVDPLAQSFVFDKNEILTSVGLFFASKDVSKSVTVQIRDLNNGFPGSQIYGEEVLGPNQITASADGSVQTKVSFSRPVYCFANRHYCVVILTDSDQYSMFVSELGKIDLITGNTVVRQPYLEGTLFSSANGLTWSPHQTMDLKFKLFTAQFSPVGVIEFNNIEDISIDRLVMFCDYLTPENTGCTWEMSLNGGVFQPIETYEDKNLPTIVTSVKLRATFKTSSNMSPLISLDNFTLVGFLTASSANYLSKQVELSQTYTSVKQIFEACIPAGCTVVPKFSTDSGETWVSNTLTSTQPVDIDFTRFEYNTVLPAGKTSFKCKLEITSPSQILRPRVRKLMNIMK